ncbi:hypothetical protein G6011_00281 [Alternaria panax]|uniref:Uncharacterized protein n=1 Tax=Alternaria panax TaxID=48097 RepID=A0AAD4IHV6_9PLEO|nr:hypothetical protein G6011_00281 [Alternaria panax]
MPQPRAKPRNEHRGYGLGPRAPSRYLLFPAHANVTAVELLAYLPNGVHCADIVYRLITNGASPHLLWSIVNTHRDLLVEWNQNSCRQGIYEAMHRGGYKNWRFKAHQTFHESRELTWDANNLDVTGYSTSGPGGAKRTPSGDIPFKNLAVDMRHEPQGYDALDFTRVVKYCANNPYEPWFYPRDYDAVLRLVGGAAPVRHEHSDREVFRRWTGVSPPPPLSASTNALLVVDKRDTEHKRKRLSNIVVDMPRSKKQKRTDTMPSAAPSMCGTPASWIQKENMRPRNRTKRTLRIEEEPMFEEIAGDEDVMIQASQYLQATAYVAPPENAILPWKKALELDDGTIDLAFASEGRVGETDPYSAYAFGSPRHTPPYRQLYRIELPDPADVSEWAENLRWTFAQNTLFRYPCRPDAWNESPEHVERIVHVRRNQGWASEEFLAEG